MKHHGNLKNWKKQLRDNLMNRLKTLYVLFPSNHPLRVEETFTQWKIPLRVKLNILHQVEGVINGAYVKGRKIGRKEGLIEGLLIGKEK